MTIMKLDKPETLSVWSITFRTNAESGYASNHCENIVSPNMELACEWIKQNHVCHHLRIINVSHKGVVSAVIGEVDGV